MPLEDEFGDIIAKARAGLHMPIAYFAEQAGLTIEQVENIEAYKFIPESETIQNIARILDLRFNALQASAATTYDPHVTLPQEIIHIPCDYGAYGVNAYLIYTSEDTAILIDTGADPKQCIAVAKQHNKTIEAVFVTHSHDDHISGVADIAHEYHCPVYGHADIKGVTKPVVDTQILDTGTLSIHVFATPGHTVDGMSYHLQNDAFACVAVGDTLFAGSAGRANTSYEDLLESIKQRIITLPPETLLLSGHGPLSTLEQEKQYNPFV